MNRFAQAIPLFLLIAGANAAEFTLADMQKMVTELEAIAPQNAKYKYPIKCMIVDKPTINAYATAEFDANDKSAKPQAVMALHSGLIKEANGDARIIRAVVAHEVSHLSNGHVYGSIPSAQDLAQFWSRAQEAEADKSGAIVLQKAGYNKQDMVDMFMLLERTRKRKGNWFARLTGSHPDPKARAAAFMDDPTVMRSLLSFDVGLAFMDGRDFDLAAAAFSKAYSIEPRLKEALLNSAQCRLLDYYDGLNSTIRSLWFRPDFGPILKDAGASISKSNLITDADRARYAVAKTALDEAVKAMPGHERANELVAVLQVLEPDADKATIRKGVDWLKDMAGKANDEVRRFRYSNNAGVGLQRLDDLQNAYVMMINVQKGSTLYSPALSENVGRLKVDKRSPELDRLAAAMMVTWLKGTPDASPNWKAVNENYLAVCKTLNVKPIEFEAAPLYLTTGLRVVIAGKQVALLSSSAEAIAILGQPEAQLRFDNRYPDVKEIKWMSGAVSASTSDDQIMRVSTTVPGSFIELKPVDSTVSGVLRIQVGMTKAEFGNVLNLEQAVERKLSNRGKVENWLYYPGLSLGIRIESDKVVAVTVTPILEFD